MWMQAVIACPSSHTLGDHLHGLGDGQAHGGALLLHGLKQGRQDRQVSREERRLSLRVRETLPRVGRPISRLTVRNTNK